MRSQLKNSRHSSGFFITRTSVKLIFRRVTKSFVSRKYSLYEADVETWKLILCLARKLEFKEVKELAIRELHANKELPLEEKMTLVQNHQVDQKHLVSYQPICSFLRTIAPPQTLGASRKVVKHDIYYIAEASLCLLVSFQLFKTLFLIF
jgi:hypothetical protein